MNNESFEIRFKRSYDRRYYRARVEISSRSENIIRFLIRAGTKEMQMEKWLFRKSNQWKIGKMNFEMKGDTKVNARMVMDIQNAIDEEYKKLYPG